DQRVVGKLAVGQDHLALRDVEILDVAHQHVAISLVFENRTQRRGDVGGRELASGDLVEERLKEMKVATIDERELDRRAPQRAGGGQTAEATADDDDAMRFSAGIGGNHGTARNNFD